MCIFKPYGKYSSRYFAVHTSLNPRYFIILWRSNVEIQLTRRRSTLYDALGRSCQREGDVARDVNGEPRRSCRCCLLLIGEIGGVLPDNRVVRGELPELLVLPPMQLGCQERCQHFSYTCEMM